MKLSSLSRLNFYDLRWAEYDLIFLASGFEDRSTFVVNCMPDNIKSRCVVLGFSNDRDRLSRQKNDATFIEKLLMPFVDQNPLGYEQKIRESLLVAARSVEGKKLRIFLDYSVMTRSWYGYILTWLKYSADVISADIDLVYAYGKYDGEFEPLHIEDVVAIPGFEGGCAGARRTVAFFGLGYDRYATLAVHELIEPDSVICYVAQDSAGDPRSKYVIDQNDELIALSGAAPVYLPLGNLDEAFRILYEQFAQISEEDEIIAVPMGPKTHVLATLMVSQFVPRVTCLHARGTRGTPVQVAATGEVSAWRGQYR